MTELTLGTRSSALAMAQSRWVKATIEAGGAATVELRIISTRGDQVQDRPLPEVGGKGLFTAELDQALLDGDIDLAVHSLKDLPTDLEDGLALAAVPAREDPSDVLVVRSGGPASLTALPKGARIGTSSVRRRALALAFRPDVAVHPIRGNVDTRLRKLEEGQVDALVLAAAGLLRLGLAGTASHPLDRLTWIPAPGQGALGIVARKEDATTAALLAPLEDALTRAAVTFERTLLATLGGGCSAPVGALGIPYDGGIRGWALAADPDGTRLVKAHRTGRLSDPGALGRHMAQLLLERGAGDLLAPSESAPGSISA